MTRESAGIAAFARIFSRLAEGDLDSVGHLVESQGLVRSTAFDVVKRMEASGLVARQVDGKVVPGATAGEFAYAGFHLGPLYGPAQTLLSWLREKTNASVVLQATNGASYTTLLNYAAPWDKGQPSGHVFVASILFRGIEAARLRLMCHAGEDDAEIKRCEKLASATAQQLQDYLA